METHVYNSQGKEAGTITLPQDIFAAQWNADLVHQVVTAMMANTRTPVAHTKTRAEVRGGGKKPWQQKGTGRARHGSSRSPIWVGGGTTHGPRNDKNYSQKINRKMKAKALASVLTKKMKDNEVLFIDALTFKAPKTAEALTILKALGAIKGYERMTKSKHAAFIALPQKDKMVEKSFSNFGSIEVGETRNLNVLNILNHKYLVIVDPTVSLNLISKNTEEAAAPVVKKTRAPKKAVAAK